MLVNDVRVDLPAVHARGKIGDEPFELYILDDPAMPLVLRWTLGDSNKRMIRSCYTARLLKCARTRTCSGGRALADCSVSTTEKPHEWSAN